MEGDVPYYRSVYSLMYSLSASQESSWTWDSAAAIVRAADRTIERIGVTLLGPFPRTSIESREVIVAVDHLTRNVETKALQNESATEVAKFFVSRLLLRHGAPRVVVSDRGTSFLSTIVTNVLRLCATVQRKSAAYHPETSGMVERFTAHWWTCSPCIFPEIIQTGTSLFHL